MNPPFSVSQSRGQDQNTAARHLRAALDHLLPGGRIVAIMPDWFSPSARYEETFRRTLEGARVVLSLRLAKGGYAKHGTGIAVRVLVIAKGPKDKEALDAGADHAGTGAVLLCGFCGLCVELKCAHPKHRQIGRAHV